MIRTTIDTYHRTTNEHITTVEDHNDARDALAYLSGYCEGRFIETLRIQYIEPSTSHCRLCYERINTEHDLFEQGANGSLYCNKCRPKPE